MSQTLQPMRAVGDPSPFVTILLISQIKLVPARDGADEQPQFPTSLIVVEKR